MFDNKKIGIRLKYERDRLGLTLEQFAEDVNISRQTLSRWEKGLVNGLTVSDVRKLSEFFNCDYGYIIGEHDCRNRITDDIVKVIGLSEDAVEQLKFLSAVSNSDESLPEKTIDEGKCELQFISEFIENTDLFNIYKTFRLIDTLKKEGSLQRNHAIAKTEDGSIYLTGNERIDALKYAAYLKVNSFIDDFFTKHFTQEENAGNGIDRKTW